MRPPTTDARRARRATSAAIAVLVAAALATGCAPRPALPAHTDRLRVVTTTGLLRDLAENVGGDRVEVVSIVPDGADPHTYEPTLRDARNVAYADVALSNYALLEEHSIIRTLDANVRDDAISVSLAEESIKYAAEIIPLVEHANLDTVWLGLRAQGDGRALGATRASTVVLTATAATGPGRVLAFLTGTFGDTDVYVDTGDGLDGSDHAELPVDAHTHLSWAFTEPGIHTLSFEARLVTPQGAGTSLGEATVTFAVGVPPASAGVADPVVLAAGHADLTVDLAERRLLVRHDPDGHHPDPDVHDPADVVIDVPAKALDEVPAGPHHRFLGHPGDAIYLLPQAVLGKHVHGEIDPHLWQDVHNAMAYVQLIRDTFIEADPAGAAHYTAQAATYLERLDAADRDVRAAVARIPADRRYLVTTHDAFGYLAHAYGLTVAGFVSPNPAVEPSLADRRRLAETLRTLRVPAVFLEPNLAARSSVLTDVAAQEGVAVCPIYGDTFDAEVTTYLELVRANADSLLTCLGT